MLNEGLIKDGANIFLLYMFIRKLTLPFEDWPAFALGLIDKDGNIKKTRKDMTHDERAEFSMFDLMILNLKKLLAKLPGGSSRIATFAAALFLLKEGKILKESEYTDSQLSIKLYEYINEAKKVINEDGSAVPTNAISTGAVAAKNDKSTILTKTVKRKKPVYIGDKPV